MALRKLILSNLMARKVRTALTVAAVALSVSLVVATTSGYSSAVGAIQRYINTFLGSSDATITRRGDIHGTIPEKWLEELRRDPDVKGAVGRLETASALLTNKDRPIGPPVQVIGLFRPEDDQVETLHLDAGQWFSQSSGNEAVIDQMVASILKVAVGDRFALPGVNKKLSLRVVGIVHKPEVVAANLQSIYLPIRTLQEFKLSQDSHRLSRIMIDLRPRTDADAFLARWQERLASADPLLKIKLTRDQRNEIEKHMEGARLVSYLGGTISMLAATFIIFSALSMGVSERQRWLAVLRSIGAQRGQLAWLVIIEGAIISLAGIIPGIPLGWLWMHVLAWLHPIAFASGVFMSGGGILLAIIGSLLSALLASFIPAYTAMRTDPLSAMSPLANPPARRLPVRSAITGLVLIALDPLIMFMPLHFMGISDGMERLFRFYAHFLLGLPSLMLGFFLLGPLLVWLVEGTLGPMVAVMVGLRFALLRQQLSGGLWRAAGTCAALMVGLATLVVMQTQGHTALAGWRLPDKFPDIFIYSYSPISFDDLKKMETMKGIKPGQVLSVAVASPELGTGVWAIGGLSLFPDATMFLGVDTDRLLDMVELDFRQGNPAQARTMLKTGHHIIITEDLAKLKKLKVGDKLPLKTLTHGTVDYTIAGVVWSPGLDVVISLFDISRQFDQRTTSSLFGSMDDARNDFGVQSINIIAANLEQGVDKRVILNRVNGVLHGWGLHASDGRAIKNSIQTSFYRLLYLFSTVAFAAMAVASLGVINTIMASIRSRRWQFGILRSIGLTRSHLLRMVLAEAILLGVTGVTMGLAAGALLAVDAKQEMVIVLGYNPPTVIPYGIIAIGAAVIMLASLLASLWPAYSLSRTEPLNLLQAGRATM